MRPLVFGYPPTPHLQNLMFPLRIIIETQVAIPIVAPTAEGTPTPMLILSEVERPSSSSDLFDPPVGLEVVEDAEWDEE